MKDYIALKKQAKSLRLKGLSYGNINKKIGVSKSTLSVWLKNVPLKEEYRKINYNKRIQNLALGVASQKERRRKEIETIVKKAGKEIELPLSNQSFLIMGAALYWAEGGKTQMFELTNSDPYMILFMVRWIENVFGIKSGDLKASLNIYSQQNEKKLKRFWSDLTGIPFINFGKSYIKPKNKNFKKNTLYYGTIRIIIPKSTDKRIQLFGWIDKIMEELQPKVDNVEVKWKSLKKATRPINLKPL